MIGNINVSLVHPFHILLGRLVLPANPLQPHGADLSSHAKPLSLAPTKPSHAQVLNALPPPTLHPIVTLNITITSSFVNSPRPGPSLRVHGRQLIPDKENPPQEILDWVSKIVPSRGNLHQIL